MCTTIALRVLYFSAVHCSLNDYTFSFSNLETKEKGDMPVEQNQDGTLKWSGDAGIKNHSNDIDPCLNPPEHKRKNTGRKTSRIHHKVVAL